MKKTVGKKLTSVLLISSMVVGSMAVFSGCNKQKQPEKEKKTSNKEAITLDVYSPLTSFMGIQEGWIADVLKEKFNVKLNIIPDSDGVYESRIDEGNLGDLIFLDKNSDQYVSAVKNGILLDWNKDNLLDNHGSYIKKSMLTALKSNQELTATITDDTRDTLYGFGGGLASSIKDHDSFFYTWDVRWDLYKKLGYPKVNNLEDFEKLVGDMVKKCPKDDNGNKTYAVSLWSVWDENMVMYVKATASAYYGYDELGIGLYDPNTGKYYDALKKDGPYLEMLKFYNRLYQDGLLDPDSKKQTYEEMIAKVKNGTTMCSIFDYAGSIEYNQAKHTNAEKMMCSLKPEEANPIVYGEMSLQGGDQIWSIGANTKYPEKCMEIINWLCTPEGRLISAYGPKDLCWKYNSENKTELTKLGKECQEKSNTKLGNGYQGTFQDGLLKLTNVTWAQNAGNPETDGETYNYDNWESNFPEVTCNMEKDWQEKTGAESVNGYFEKGDYTVSQESSYEQSKKSAKLKKTWKLVTSKLVNASWDAIYAKSDSEYNRIVDKMIKDCKKSGYQDCVTWSSKEAARRKSLEDAIAK